MGLSQETTFLAWWIWYSAFLPVSFVVAWVPRRPTTLSRNSCRRRPRKIPSASWHSNNVALRFPIELKSIQRSRDLAVSTALSLFAFKNGPDGDDTNQEQSNPGQGTQEIDDDENEKDKPSWIRAIRQWPLRESNAVSGSGVDQWLLGGPLQDHEADWLEEIVGGGGVTDEDNSTLPSASVLKSVSSSRISSSSTSFLRPLVSLLNMEALLFDYDEAQTDNFAGDSAGNESTGRTLVASDSLPGSSSTNASQIFASILPLSATLSANTTASLARGIATDWTVLEELGRLDQWADSIRRGISTADPKTFSKSAEAVLKQATTRIESLVADASAVISPATLQALINRARQAVPPSNINLLVGSENNVTSSGEMPKQVDLIEAAKRLALDRGLDVAEAAERARETTAYAVSLVTVADGVIRKGYVDGDFIAQRQRELQNKSDAVMLDDGVADGSQALFADYPSAEELNTYGPSLAQAAEMGALSGAIYEETIPRTHALNHAIVAQGRTKDVFWMVTDKLLVNASAFNDRNVALTKDPMLVRTLTIRGFDASDEGVDRERLINGICAAAPERLKSQPDVLIHSGLMSIARAIYKDVKQYIDWCAPTHKIILNGHSIGGSLSLLMLLLMTDDRGPEYVRNKILRVFTFGNPAVVCLRKPRRKTSEADETCDILKAFELPTNIVHGFAQPWDPVVRLFTQYDPLYPLAGGLGDDGVTPWANGPPRTLRTITKKIFEAWDGWPRFRETFRGQANQNYTSVGIQHILLPEPTRFLADRFVAVNIPVPPIETVLKISSRELLPALCNVFPLSTFEISFVPQAIRSFVHHFYPAYDMPLVAYVRRKAKGNGSLGPNNNGSGKSPSPPKAKKVSKKTATQFKEPALTNSAIAPSEDNRSILTGDAGPSWNLAAQWLQGKEGQIETKGNT